MNRIATAKDDGHIELARMLEGFEYPAILLNGDYEILAFNQLYLTTFGEIDLRERGHRCYEVSHGYTQPCDQAGEDCPLSKVRETQKKERVLHIHQTHNGHEHVEIEMLPIEDKSGAVVYFVELLKPIPLASGARASQSMVGSSPAFVRMLDRIAKVGKSSAAVLLLGETGTGKELAAKAIHQSSLRKDKPLITLECSGLTDTLFESELFGYTKGAFTGANSNKKGLVELAHGGTLFLDEIADVPISMQVKLLRLLENRTFRSLGSTEVKSSDFRLICATHKNIHQLIAQERFRLDLYHRINVFPIALPPLRERLEDVPQIAKALLVQLEPEQAFYLTDSSIQLLQEQPMPGNIRELRNILNRAVVLAETNIISRELILECLEAPVTPALPQVASAGDGWTDLKTQEYQYLVHMRQAFHGDIKKMAQTLGISERSLYRKMKDVKDWQSL
ncbi:sigma-54 interaction domain-containing protein [Teredinibacter haidensis]|uniref:sigma-54 interaction domain-containing protein n=1 Tax=Teredinibacter haidensis TaxID=2731755 RepID=UPI000948F4F8|nr:sigma-54-dependent Fis family transcriptional regulator [Teredinibacter haidensis]